MSLSLVDDTTTVSKLKEQICAAVEVEIQNQVTEYEISDEEHIALSHAAWSRFYSCAVQYHETGLVPMGLIVNDRSGLITIIKKNNFSFVRPIEALEHLGNYDTNLILFAYSFFFFFENIENMIIFLQNVHILCCSTQWRYKQYQWS